MSSEHGRSLSSFALFARRLRVYRARPGAGTGHLASPRLARGHERDATWRGIYGRQAVTIDCQTAITRRDRQSAAQP